MSATETTNRQTRSRIVIDINQAQKGRRGGGAGRGGVRRVLSFIALILVAALGVLAVGGFAWWRNYKSSPAYSLALLADAAQRDDLRAVDELVDSNQVAENFIPQVAGKIYGAEIPPAQAENLRKQVEALAPQMLPGVRDQIREEIVGIVKEVGARAGGRVPFVLLALGVPRAASEIIEEGDAARASFNFNNRPVELTMQRNGARWRVVAVKNEELAAGIAARVVGGLPLLSPPAGRPAETRRTPARPSRPASTPPRNNAPATTGGGNSGGVNQ